MLVEEIKEILGGEIINHKASGISNEEVAKEINVSLDNIIKCLIIKNLKANTYYSCVILATKRLNFKKISELIGTSKKCIRMATVEEITRLGYTPGSIPVTTILENFIEKGFVCHHVLGKDFVIGSAGREHYGIKFDPKVLIKIGYIPSYLCISN